MRFTKMHGIGNDYVYVDCFRHDVADPAAMAIAVSDRHFGIGADGLVLILPSSVADVRMRMFNADGSEGKMCGNGIRCVAKYSYDHGLTRSNPMKVETLAGVKTIDLQLVDGGKVAAVTVDMGTPILAAKDIPVRLPDFNAADKVADLPLEKYMSVAGPAGWMERCGLEKKFTCVSMGNPHLMLYCRDVQAVPLEIVGPMFETQPIFPDRINVHVVQIHSPGEVTMRTWERGSGITLACGTGASAVCVAGAMTGRNGREIVAHLPGGDLKLEWRQANDHLFMTGPATEVFSGEWE